MFPDYPCGGMNRRQFVGAIGGGIAGASALLLPTKTVSAAQRSEPGRGIPGPFPGRVVEAFDMRQPQHIPPAGTLGLGVFDKEKIEHRRVELA